MSKRIIDELKDIIESESKKNISDFSEKMTFTNLGIESMDRIRIVIQVERKFRVEFSETEAASIDTIGDLVNFIQINSGVKK
ncbi:hypothetical protein CN507_29225 [Bacillus cereus]|nr:hypothetical protein CN507_29225 [Bacillus cereus]